MSTAATALAKQDGGVKGFFKKLFPFISAAASLGGPAGTLAAQTLGKFLGADGQPVHVEPTEEGIFAALQTAAANADQILAAQKAEQDYQYQCKKLGFATVQDLLDSDNSDRKDARAREVAVRDSTPRIIAYVVVALTIFLEGWVLLHGLPKTTDPVLAGRVLGTCDAALMAVLFYYFGTSAGSARKTELLAQSPPVEPPA